MVHHPDPMQFWRRALDGVRLSPHERSAALSTLERAEHIAEAIAGSVAVGKAIWRSYRRHAGHRHPHPSHP